MRALFLFCVLSVGLLSGPARAAAAPVLYEKVSQAIATKFQAAIASRNAGDLGEAQGLVTDSYFDLFEGSGMETKIGIKSPALKSSLEADFNKLRAALEHEDATQLTERATALVGRLQAASYQLDHQQGAWEIFLSAFMILLREGFEAILVVSAIVAVLIKTGQNNLLSLVRSALAWAIAASFLTAVAFGVIFKVSAAQQELIEGLTMLIACGVLFTVGHWLIAQAESQRWSRYIQGHVKNSLGPGKRRALWFTCFLAVYREGAETVLFYQALWSSSSKNFSSIGLGFAAASVALAFIYLTFKRGVLRIPLKPFFRVTSSLLYLLAFIFAGRAVIELQAGGFLLVKELKGWPTVDVLGIYPTLQSLMFQALFLLAFAFSIFWIFLKNRYFNKDHIGVLA